MVRWCLRSLLYYQQVRMDFKLHLCSGNYTQFKKVNIKKKSRNKRTILLNPAQKRVLLVLKIYCLLGIPKMGEH